MLTFSNLSRRAQLIVALVVIAIAVLLTAMFIMHGTLFSPTAIQSRYPIQQAIISRHPILQAYAPGIISRRP